MSERRKKTYTPKKTESVRKKRIKRKYVRKRRNKRDNMFEKKEREKRFS